ncbi:Cna B-type domain-containing protein [Erysipelotrichaceae bacterium OH741_COT-311]|nr:Cna B-type domain-containing protein [Erysipelotrichaceae bacterium OH741_COT-311]
MCNMSKQGDIEMKKIVKTLILMCSIVCFLFAGIQTFAEEKGITFTNITLTKRDGSPLGNVNIWEEMKFNLNFSIPNGTVSSGDTTTIKMNRELTFTQEVPIEIKKDNKTFANVTFNKAKNEILITYTDEIANLNDIEGSFFFLVRVENAIVIGEQDVPVTLVSNGATIYNGSIHYNGAPAAKPFDLQKVGWKTGGSDKRSLDYRIDVNQKNIEINNAVITDRFGDETNLDISNILIYRGQWVDAGDGTFKLNPSEDVTSQFTIHLDADKKGFHISLGNVAANEGYRIRYRATTSYDPIQGEKIKNTVTLTGDNVTIPPVTSILTYNVGGSEIIGYQYKIKVVKKDENGQLLKDAEFKLVRDATGIELARLKTNAAGEIIFDNLLKDAYTITEVAAPNGYLLNTTPIKVLSSDFNDQKIATKEFVNKRADEKINVVVNKKWLKKEAASATFKLLKDNVDTGKRLTLTAQMNWTGSFDGLDKYDLNDGHEIEYSIEEIAIDNYDYSLLIKGPYEFDVLNFEIFTVNVKKEWYGASKNSATLKLYADNVDTGEEIVVNEASNWSGQFVNLPKYDLGDNHEIVYSVREVAIPGYTTRVEGNTTSGFVVKNISQETIHVPVTVKWNGPKKDHAMIKLLANNVDTGQTLRIEEAMNWQGSFPNLFKYDQMTGEEIVYSIQQTPIPGYVTNIVKDPTGFVVTNTKVILPNISNVDHDDMTVYSPKISIPKTGDTTSNVYGLLFVASVVSIILLIKYRKEEKVN